MQKFFQIPKFGIDFGGFVRYNTFLHETVLPHGTNAIGGGVTMPNIKSAKKRVLLSRAANEANKQVKTALKTTIKKFETAYESGNKAEADSAYAAAIQSIDKAVTKGILHKNTAARKKSNITLKMNKLA